jgi:dynein heavy chain
LAQKIINLIGDCLTTSSFLSYAGPFNFEFRKRMIYEDWRNDIKNRNIPMSISFRL